MKDIEEAIHGAATIDDLFPVIDRMAQEMERIKVPDSQGLGMMQLFASYLTEIRLAVSEMMRREIWDQDGSESDRAGAKSAARFLELGQRTAELQERLDERLRRGRYP